MAVVGKVTTTIDGVTYTTTMFPATRGLELFIKLARMVDESVLTLILGVDFSDFAAVISDPSVVFGLVRSVATNSEPAEFSAFCRELCEGMTADKVKIGEMEIPGSVAEHFDGHFAGRYFHLLEVLGWAARAGFGAP